MSRFEKILSGLGKVAGTSTISTNDLKAELLRREKEDLRYPLEVFPSSLKALIDYLVDDVQLEESYVGNTMLAISAGAIGNAFQGGLNPALPTCVHGWYANVGESSAGKTLTLTKLGKPIYDIEEGYREEFGNLEIAAISGEGAKQKWELDRKAILKQNSKFEAFVRDGLLKNPKGLMRWHDELLEWINNMYQYSKGDTMEEQFWLSSWSNSFYATERTGNREFFIPKFRSGCTLLGGTQPALLHKLFEKQRYEAGLINRILFAVPKNESKILIPNPFKKENQTVFKHWAEVINALHFGLPVYQNSEPLKATFSDSAVNLIYNWQLQKREEITQTDDLVLTRSVMGNYFGKICEYSARFSMVLMLIDMAAAGEPLKTNIHINSDVAERSIKLCEYYLLSFSRVYMLVFESNMVPQQAIEFATLLKCKYSLKDIADMLNLVRKKPATDQAKTMAAKRKFQEYLSKYPNLFNINDLR
jgi:hypothetical protein